MLTNTDATLYKRQYDKEMRLYSWEREYLPAVWWYEQIKSVVNTDGIQNTNVTTVRIPDLNVEVKKGDYIVKGNCELQIETIKDLEGYHKFEVIMANYNRFGWNQHIKVGG